MESQNEEVINAEPVAYVMLDFCEKTFNKNDVNGEFVRSSWEGTPADLYQNLTERAQSLGIKTESRNSSWPKAPNAFTRRLNEISSSLLAKGFEVEVKPGTPRKVIITVGKQTQLIVDADGKQKSEAEDKELHFCRLPVNETHVCSSCKGLEAVFRQADVFLCRGCFDGAVRRAVADGCVVVEDQTEDTD